MAKEKLFPKYQMAGYCSACGVVIMDIKIGKKKASAKKLPNFKEHIIELSNNTIMKVGVCDEHKVELVSGKAKKTADDILKNHKAYWKEKANKNKKLKPKNFEKLEVVNPNTDLLTFLKKREREKDIIINLDNL